MRQAPSIDGYGGGGFRVSGARREGSLLILDDEPRDWPVKAFADLTVGDLQAVSIDPQNPEVRFLRFSVESNLPAFLGLSKHVDEDKEMLLNAALSHPKSGLDAEAFRTVRDFLVARGHVSEGDAQKLNKVKE